MQWSKNYSRFIPCEEVGAVTRWHFGAVDGSDLAALPEPDAPPAPSAQEQAAAIESLLLQAREEGHAAGLAQGQHDTALQWQQRMDAYIAGQGTQAAQRLHSMAQQFDASLHAMQQHMAHDVLLLACALARQVLRRELEGNPNALLPVVREAVGLLVADGRPTTVRLNPVDMDMLGAALRTEYNATPVQWLADASVVPGDCLAESGGAVVDGRLDARWRNAIAALGLASGWNGDQDTPGLAEGDAV